jgi:hypothetical protein
MVNRILAAAAAVALAGTTRAEEPAQPLQAQPASLQQELHDRGAQPFDASAIQGKIDTLAEQTSATQKDVAGLKKLKISGYVQARETYAESPTPIYTGTAPKDTGFTIRRGRFKAVYDADGSQFALQLDATPKGVALKEAFARLKLPVKGVGIDAGLQLLPFGYDVGVRSSADLDLLERADFARTFLKGEYDLGVSLVAARGPFNAKVGVFNGNGVDAKTGGLDNDQHKDVIGRVGFDAGVVTGGVSGWYGQTINYKSSEADRTFDRARVGADVQVYLDLLPFGGTAVKGEYLWGKTQLGEDNGGAGVALGKIGWGWDAIVTQNVGRWNQLALRYQQFNPDVKIDRDANPTKVFVQDEIATAVHTLIGGNMKLSLAYYHPMYREKGAQAKSSPDKDSVMAQLQAKF